MKRAAHAAAMYAFEGCCWIPCICHTPIRLALEALCNGARSTCRVTYVAEGHSTIEQDVRSSDTTVKNCIRIVPVWLEAAWLLKLPRFLYQTHAASIDKRPHMIYY